MPKGWVENSGRGVYPMYSGVGTDVAVSEPAMYPYPGGVSQNWDHKAGRTCFTRTIDPEIYKPYNPVPVVGSTKQ